MMKKSYLVLFVLAILLASCGGVRKHSKTVVQPEPIATPVVIEEPVKAEPVTVFVPEPVREVEEKLVPVDDKPVNPHSYFVIIGSFRSVDNAGRHQADIAADGFRVSELMRNEAGLYRVSVMATDDVLAARTEIMRIRSRFPKYNDVWLLISKQ